MAAPTIYHNPACSKSRATLELLREAGHPPEVVEYLATPPDIATLRGLCRMLGVAPRALLREGERIFAERYAAAELDDEGALSAMAAHPELIQRPIVVAGDRAALGRPPEAVLALFES